MPHAVQHISFAQSWSGCWFVACGMLVHSSSMAVWSCWILPGTGTCCRIRRSRASQTCSMGDYAGHARTVMFSASRNCVQILTTWGRALSCCNMRWWSWMNGTTMCLRISSRFLCAFKMPLIKCTCVCCPYACPYHTITPSPTWATRSTTLTSANRSPTQRLSCWLHRKYLRSLSSAHEKWGQKQKCCVYHFFQCI